MKGRYKEGYAHHQMKKGHFDPKKVDPGELKKGIRVEYEHTSNPEIARQIALDHLAENEKYYTLLIAMEEAAEKTGWENVLAHLKMAADGTKFWVEM